MSFRATGAGQLTVCMHKWLTNLNATVRQGSPWSLQPTP
jgi:hypothetical protein